MIYSLHEGIDSIRSGEIRYCQRCKKTVHGKNFPYKSRELCFECYERETGKTLHSFRNKLGVKTIEKSKNSCSLRVDGDLKKTRTNKEVQLSDCISSNKKIEISYRAKHGHRRNRIIKPQKINGHLLTAYCYFRNEERVFNMSKIKILGFVD